MASYHNSNTNWKRYFAYLKFLRWFKFYQYFFMFLFFVLSTYYFFDKQVHYVRKVWSIYDSYFYTSSIGLEPDKYYYVSWDNDTYYLVYIIVDGEASGNSTIGNFYTSTRKPSELEVHVFQRHFNPFSMVFSVREIKVEEVNYVDDKKYLSVDTLKYFIHKKKNK